MVTLITVILTKNILILINGSRYSRMDQVKFFKGCLPQILLGPFLNTSTQIKIVLNNDTNGERKPWIKMKATSP